MGSQPIDEGLGLRGRGGVVPQLGRAYRNTEMVEHHQAMLLSSDRHRPYLPQMWGELTETPDQGPPPVRRILFAHRR